MNRNVLFGITLQRPPLLPSFLVVIGIAILCSLGIWQLQRLAWKEALLASMAVSDVVEGAYLPVPALQIAPRTHDGEIGAHLYRPFRVAATGQVIFVNRGWIPANWRERASDIATHSLVGVYVAPPRANRFTPANDPAQGQWYHPDPQEMAVHYNISQEVSTDVLFFVTEDQNAAQPPHPIQPQSTLRNDHRQYALFWFTMAGVLLGIFMLRFCVRMK